MPVFLFIHSYIDLFICGRLFFYLYSFIYLSFFLSISIC